MKKILFGLRNLLKSYFLQFLLTVVGFESYLRIVSLSSEYKIAKGDADWLMDWDTLTQYGEGVPIDVAITSGFDGAALAAGLVCSTCIVMIVWIEIKKNRTPSN